MPATSATRTRILILGGGFAGFNALQGLERRFAHRDDVEMTLISRDNFVLFTPMLAEVAIGSVDPRHILTPLRELCRKTRFYRGDVEAIDLIARQVTVCYPHGDGAMQETLGYDQLVLATGSTSNRMMVKGVEPYAFDFKSVGDAMRIRNHILEMFERATVIDDPVERQAMLTFTVVGGGYSGVELAAAIRELTLRILPLYPDLQDADIKVLLIEALPGILNTLPKSLSDYATKYLKTLGVDVRVDTKLAEVGPDWIAVGPDERIATSMAVWTTGVMIPKLITDLPVEKKDPKGRPYATETLQLCGYDNVWAVGDNVLSPNPKAEPNTSGIYPATAQLASQQGAHLADNLVRAIDGRPLKPFQYKYRGEMVVLGERSAVALVYGIQVIGIPAWMIWRLVYLMKLPRFNKRLRVALDWILNLFGPMETSQPAFPASQPLAFVETAVSAQSDTAPVAPRAATV